jgi:hypothetical protein
VVADFIPTVREPRGKGPRTRKKMRAARAKMEPPKEPVKPPRPRKEKLAERTLADVLA